MLYKRHEASEWFRSRDIKWIADHLLSVAHGVVVDGVQYIDLKTIQDTVWCWWPNYGEVDNIVKEMQAEMVGFIPMPILGNVGDPVMTDNKKNLDGLRLLMKGDLHFNHGMNVPEKSTDPIGDYTSQIDERIETISALVRELQRHRREVLRRADRDGQ